MRQPIARAMSYSDRTSKLTRDRADRLFECKARDADAAGGNGKSSNAAIGEIGPASTVRFSVWLL